MARTAEVGWAGWIRVPPEGPCREQQQVGGGGGKLVKVPERRERDRETGSRKRGTQKRRGRLRQTARKEREPHRRWYRKDG